MDGVGPLDAKAKALVKIGICVGAGLESALRSHVRRAGEAGASREEIEQAISSWRADSTWRRRTCHHWRA